MTEMILGIDMVRMQIEVAEGRAIQLFDAPQQGHAIEARLYAEDPANGFLPSTGKVLAWRAPRECGSKAESRLGPRSAFITILLLAKIIAHAPSREGAIRKLRHALENTLVHGRGYESRVPDWVLDHPDFVAGRIHTGFAIPFEPDRSAERRVLRRHSTRTSLRGDMRNARYLCQPCRLDTGIIRFRSPHPLTMSKSFHASREGCARKSTAFNARSTSPKTRPIAG